MNTEVHWVRRAVVVLAVCVAVGGAAVVGVADLAGATARLGPGPPPKSPDENVSCKVDHESMVTWDHMPKGTELTTLWIPPHGAPIYGVQRLGIKARGRHAEKTPAHVNTTWYYRASFDHPVASIAVNTQPCD